MLHVSPVDVRLLPAGVGGLSHLKHVPAKRWWLVVLLQQRQATCWLLPQKEPLQWCKEEELTSELLPLLLSVTAAQPQAKDSGYVYGQVTAHFLLQVGSCEPPLRWRKRWRSVTAHTCFNEQWLNSTTVSALANIARKNISFSYSLINSSSLFTTDTCSTQVCTNSHLCATISNCGTVACTDRWVMVKVFEVLLKCNTSNKNRVTDGDRWLCSLTGNRSCRSLIISSDCHSHSVRITHWPGYQGTAYRQKADTDLQSSKQPVDTELQTS